jgi:putative ABC transport system substrate-binding protein
LLRRIGALLPYAADDPQAQGRHWAFLHGLRQPGWSPGQNLQIEYRRAGGRAADTRRYAAELAALVPEVILASGSAAIAPLLQETRNVPIVFVLVPDPCARAISTACRGRAATPLAS